MRHFLTLMDHTGEELNAMLDLAQELKAERKAGKQRDTLTGQTLAMIFEKPSTRTRVSFEVAMCELGGRAMVLQKQDLQLGRGETVADTAQVLSRYIHAMMLRSNSHATLEELAEYADVPVINGLTDLHHPLEHRQPKTRNFRCPWKRRSTPPRRSRGSASSGRTKRPLPPVPTKAGMRAFA